MATHSSILAWRIPMDRGTWRATVRGVAKSWTRLSDQAQHRMSQRRSSASLGPCRLSVQTWLNRPYFFTSMQYFLLSMNSSYVCFFKTTTRYLQNSLGCICPSLKLDSKLLERRTPVCSSGQSLTQTRQLYIKKKKINKQSFLKRFLDVKVSRPCSLLLLLS